MPPSTGARLGPYQLGPAIGAGGMGEVYRARDPRLGRDVAIKILPSDVSDDPDRLRRFEQEARATASLNHPGILAVFDVGTDNGVAYLVTELLEGRTLRDELPTHDVVESLALAKALDYAVQLADALGAAHARGVVHRDLKPENIFVTTDNRIKILDFGLAKVVDAVPAESETASGVIVGTVGYMAPEQVRGQKVDARTDVFAFGCVLYELLSGRRAFTGDTSMDTLSAILHRTPVPLSDARPASPCPPLLTHIVERCLAKAPGERFQTAADLGFALRQVGQAPHGRSETGSIESGSKVAAATSRRRWIPVALGALALGIALVAGYTWYARPERASSAADVTRTRIAVLPFQNLGAAGDEYFAAGMTEEIMSRLAAVSRLAVTSRNSVLQYATTTKSWRQIGTDELKVDYLVQGTVRWQPATDGPGLVRVTPQLIRVADDTQVWSDTYERQFNEIFTVQSDIAGRVIQELNITVLALERTIMEGRPTSNFEAYREYLRGYSFWYRDRDRGAALKQFEHAVALDPEFAIAHAAVAIVAADTFFYREPTPALQEKADASIAKALALDPNLAEAYLARGTLLWSQPHGFPHDAALRELRSALALNPSLAEGRVALGKIYEHIGLLDEARDQFTQAAALDPANREAPGRTWYTYWWQHDYARALAEAERLGIVSYNVVALLSYAGRDGDARRRADELVKGPWVPSLLTSFNIVLLAREGQRARVDAALPALEALAKNPQEFSHAHHAQYWLALTHAVLNRKREAMTWLRMSAAQGFPCYPFFAKDPNLANLQGDFYFEAFMTDLKAQWERLRAEAR